MFSYNFLKKILTSINKCGLPPIIEFILYFILLGYVMKSGFILVFTWLFLLSLLDGFLHTCTSCMQLPNRNPNIFEITKLLLINFKSPTLSLFLTNIRPGLDL